MTKNWIGSQIFFLLKNLTSKVKHGCFNYYPGKPHK